MSSRNFASKRSESATTEKLAALNIDLYISHLSVSDSLYLYLSTSLSLYFYRSARRNRDLHKSWLDSIRCGLIEFEYLQRKLKFIAKKKPRTSAAVFIGWTQYYPSTVLSVRCWSAVNTKLWICTSFSSVRKSQCRMCCWWWFWFGQFKLVCLFCFVSPVQMWSKRPTAIAWEDDSIFYRLLDSIHLESNPACYCMVSDVNRRPLVVLEYIVNSWTAYRLLNPKTNKHILSDLIVSKF